MTGYKSKKEAALDEEGMYLVHQTAQPVGQAPCVRHCESTAYEIVIRGLKGDIERMKAAQRPWVDLTDSQIEQVYYDLVKIHRGAPMPWGQINFGKTLQALIKEKNT